MLGGNLVQIVVGPVGALLLTASAAGAAGSGGEARVSAARVVVVGTDSSPVEEAVLRGIRERVLAHRSDLSLQPLRLDATATIPSEKRQRLVEAEVVVTMGNQATALVREEAPEAALVATLIPSSLGAEGIRGVHLDFPYEVQLDWLARVLPRVRRVGVLVERGGGFPVERARGLARERGLALEVQVVDSPRDLPRALERFIQSVDALWTIPAPLLSTPQAAKGILLFSLRQRIPLVGLSESWTRAGALYSLERDYVDVGRQAGDQVLELILGRTGVPARTLPPRAVRLSVNERVMRRMRLRIDRDLLEVGTVSP